MIFSTDDYREWLAAGAKVSEVPARLALAGTELELQARWFAGDFGWEFTAVSGESVRVVQPGVWNREAGPDFAEAAVSVDSGEPKRGAIELDVEARDWERHGHAENPIYESVVLHLYFQRGAAEFFTRTVQHRNVLQVQLDLRATTVSLPESLLAKPGRCSAPLASMDEMRARAILEAAAHHRWQNKAARLSRLEQAHGANEALYQAVAETLGYKGNQLAFLLLAQRVPLALARSVDGEALLFGVSGFLPGEISALESETRAYLREIWSSWWRRRAEFEQLIVPANAWKLSGHRPLNHPQRRVAALAEIARQWKRWRSLGEACDAAGLLNLLAAAGHDYWQWHYTLTSKIAPREMALVGEERIRQMLANVFYPWRGRTQPEAWEDFRKLSAASLNRRALTAATRLFGAEPDRRWLSREVWQQGMLQVYEDFCRHDLSDCAACPFPRQLAQIAGKK